MKRRLWTRVLRSLFQPQTKTVTHSRPRSPILEHLESRLAPATFIWSGGGGAANRNWSNPANWVGNLAPDGALSNVDDLVFPATATQRNTNNDLPQINGAAPTFNSITISASNYTLAGNQITLGNPSVSNSGNVIVNSLSTNVRMAFDVQLAGPPGSRQLFTINSGADLTIAGKLSGNTGNELAKPRQSTGRLILSGDNSGFTGPITLEDNAGSLLITNVNALGSASVPTTIGTNSQLLVSNVGNNNPIQERVILNGFGPDSRGALVNLAGSNVWAGPIILDSDVSMGSIAGTMNVTGQISDTATGHNLTKEEAGTIIFSSANTYRGLTTINNGILRIRNPLSLGAQGTAVSGTVVASSLTGTGTLQLEAPTGSTGFTVFDERLTLNGPGFNEGNGALGALSNLTGNNTWSGGTASTIFLGSPQPNTRAVQIGVEANTTLFIDGIISDPNVVFPAPINAPDPQNFQLSKIRPGTLVFTNANTYRGATNVATGILQITDSRGLGTAAGGTTVSVGASLELAIDTGLTAHGRDRTNDSVTANFEKLRITEVITINGRGLNNGVNNAQTGALRNRSGINQLVSDVFLGDLTSFAAIGVDPDPTSTASNLYFTNDWSLTLLAQIQDPRNPANTGFPAYPRFNPTDLGKLLGGHLILTQASTNFRGQTFISEGWVTIQNNDALGGNKFIIDPITGSFLVDVGDTVQPGTFVYAGAALHFKSPTANGVLTVPENLVLNGTGITHPFGLISQKGALMSISGNNLSTGEIKLNGQVGIGVENLGPATISELTTRGKITDFQSFTVENTAAGTETEDSRILDVGTTAGGILNITYDFLAVPDTLRVYYPPRGFAGSTLVFDTGLVNGINTITVPFGPGTSTLVEIVMNEGTGITGTVWEYTATATPGNLAPGGITKLGSRRLRIQGDGTYTNDVIVAEGVLRAQNDTALGSSVKGTTVLDGTALELSATNASNAGGIVAGLQVRDETLTLRGTGNTALTGTLLHPLTVLDNDHSWRGPIRLETPLTIDTRQNTRLSVFGAISDAVNTTGTSDLRKIGLGEMMLVGVNTYRGTTFVDEGIVTVANGQGLGSPAAGTEVKLGATLQLQGDITVAGESLKVIGSGTGTVPSILPIRWFNQGPGSINNGETPGNRPVSGRIVSVATDPTDPNVIYIAAGTGGVWKTKDKGVTWQPLLDNIINSLGGSLAAQTMFIGSVAVSTTNPRVIYVGTGGENNGAPDSYAGIGLLKSTDSGKTWTLDNNNGVFTGKAINKVIVDFDNENVVYVSVTNAGVNNRMGGNGIWRFNAAGWTNITQTVSPTRATQTPPLTTGGPDDQLTRSFLDTDDISDFVMQRSAAGSAGRIMAFAIGNTSGVNPLGTFTGMTIPVTAGGFNNAVFVSVNGQAATPAWVQSNFQLTEDQITALSPTVAVTFPVNGVIKLAISSFPGLKANNQPGDYRIYATVSYPDRGFNATLNRQAGTTVSLPLPQPFQNNAGLERTLRSVQRNEVNWDPTQGIYVVGGWTGVTPPQAIGSTTSPTTHATNPTREVGRGNFGIAIAVDNGVRPEANGEDTDVVYVGGVGPLASSNAATAPGVVRTFNGGGAWADVTIGADGNAPGAYSHAMHFDSNNQLLLGSEGGLNQLTNATAGAIAWTNRNGNINISQLTDVALHPTNVNIAYAGANNNGTQVYTGGVAWQQIDNGAGGQVYVDPTNPNIIYHIRATVLGSTLRKSVDGGQTWADLLQLRSGRFWAPRMYDDNGAAVYGLVDFDASSPFVLDSLNTQRIVIGEYSPVRDPGYRRPPETPGTNPSVGIQPQPPVPLLRESLDGGATFINIGSRLPVTVAGTRVISFDAVAIATFQGTFTPDDRFQLVTDKGSNVYDPDTIYTLALFQNTTTLAYVQRIFVTKNRGQSWSEITAATFGLQNGANIVSLTVDPTNRDVVYAVCNTPGGSKLFQSANAGQSWRDVTFDLPALPAYKLVIDPRSLTNNLYLGTDQGVFRLDTALSQWKRFGAGMPNVQVRDLELNQTTNVLTAGTYGRGMYQYYLSEVGANAGALTATSGSPVWAGPVLLTGDTTISAGGSQSVQGLTSTAKLTILGTISSDDASQATKFKLTKLGKGDVILAGSNDYRGVTEVIQGVLVVANPQALGSPLAPTIVDSETNKDTALQLQTDLLDEPLNLRGNGITFNGHPTGVLRNISGNNKYTGTATLDGPIVVGVDSGTSLTIAGNGRFFDPTQSTARSIKKELTGTLVFQTANDFSGEMFVQQGVLNVQHPGALGRTTRGTQVVDAAQLQIERNAVTGVDTVIVGEALELSGTGINLTGAFLNTIGNNVWRGPVTLAGVPNVFPTTMPADNVSIGVRRDTDTLTIDGVIDQDPLGENGKFGLTKVLPGRLTLTKANTYDGTTVVQAGALRIQNGAALGTTNNGTTVNTGAVLELDGGFTTTTETLTLNGTGLSGTGALHNVGGNNTYAGNVILNTVGAPTVAVAVDANLQLAITGTVRDPNPAPVPAAALDKIGTGTLAFAADNSYTGKTTVSEGVLNISNDGALGDAVNERQTVDISGLAGEFTLTFNGATTAPLPFNADEAAIQAALNQLSSILDVGGSVTVTRTTQITFLIEFGGSLANLNVPQITATPSGGVFSDQATVNDGSEGTVVAAGATLQLQGGITVSTEALIVNGQGFGDKGALENLAGTNTWDKTIVLGSASFIGATGAGSTLIINQPITDEGNDFPVTKVGPGTVEYRAGNTYTGLTQVNEGTLVLNNANGQSLNGDLTVGDTLTGNATARLGADDQIPNDATVFVQSDGTFDVNGKSEAIDTLRMVNGQATTGPGSGLLTVNNLDMTGGVFNVATTGGRLILAGDVTATSASATQRARITGPGQVSLNGETRTFTVANGLAVTDLIVEAILSGSNGEGLIKAGAGRLELDAVNTYTEATTINEGDVQVDGQIANVVLANTAASVSGTGTIGTITGPNGAAVGTVNPGDNDVGNSAGVLTSGTATWGPQTTFFVNLDDADGNPATQPVPGVEHDQLVVNGTADLNGATLAGTVDPDVKIGTRYTILRTQGGMVTNRFAEPFGANIAFVGGQKFTVEYFDTRVVLTRVKNDVLIAVASSANPSVFGQPVVFTVTVSPEPGGMAVPDGTTVTFTFDGGVQQTKTLVNGQATFDPQAFLGTVLSVGLHTLDVRFNGNADFNDKTGSLTPAQTVNRASTQVTTTTTTPNPVFGQAITVVATVTVVAPGAGVPSGGVIFTIDGTTQVPGTLNAGGQATVMLPTNLSVGMHRVTVAYNGDNNFLPSTTTTDLEVTIGQAASTVQVRATPGSSILNQQVTFTATVTATPPGGGTPAGMVSFFDGDEATGTLLGTRQLNGSGVATLNTSTLAVGMHTITVVYAGNGSFTGNTGTLNFRVAGAATTTGVAIAPEPSVFGQQVRVTAIVTPDQQTLGIATGSVVFSVGGVPLAPAVVLDNTGKASILVNSFPVGTTTVVATYTGTGNFGDSVGQNDQTVNRANTTTTVTSSLNPSATGQMVTFTARVTARAPGGFTPTSGTVTFVIDNVAQAPVAINAQGVATITRANLGRGNHTILARFNGNNNYVSSPNSAPLTQRVVAFGTSTTLTRTANPSVFGQTVTFTARVVGTGGRIPTGTVTFLADGVRVGSPVALNSTGRASLAIKSLAAGVRNVTAVYSGAPDFASSQATLQQTVLKGNTATVVTASRNPAFFTLPVTVTATVTPRGASTGVPTGTVVFTIDGVPSNPVALVNGRASLVVPGLALGNHAITADYQGSGNFEVSQSAQFNLPVVVAPPAVRLTATFAPASGVGVGLPFSVTAVARDATGAVAEIYQAPGTVSVASAPPGATLSGNVTVNFVNGVAQFTGLTVNRAGRYVLRVTSGTLVIDLTFTTVGRQT